MEPLTLDRLPSREALAAWIELEVALVAATSPASDERRALPLRALASRPNDNDHVASGRRIAAFLRDSSVPLSTVLDRVRGARHFRAAVRRVLTRFIETPATPSRRDYRQEYLDSLAPRQIGEDAVEVERPDDDLDRTQLVARYKGGSPVEQVIEVSVPAWPVPGASEETVDVRTDQGIFNVPVSVVRCPDATPNVGLAIAK